ncbi:N-acetyl-gamma-glutamyl-phosphate reductase [Lysobacter soyae]|uniref:N-acetyl-gamma-glutamyl-phosphate reductase n=1 Tax=Lysobacter soyae TaxID=2764185 RepID=A0ABX8WS77_9GAMM|nr:N-acetyl-gamma-glutamyl-phosphate reductase [Lysobacter sp. CJ11]QYR53680.1 N-acetyl-gamma-glutamyl-phosphate reductase [Lysobacter sp. CJ11]
MTLKIGLVGARGHVGEALIRIIDAHPDLSLGFVSSRERVGKPLSDFFPGLKQDLVYSQVAFDEVGRQPVDVFVLALPNGMAADCVSSIERFHPDALVVDLSADYRFDSAWYYGLPELTRTHAAGARRISNPGCYASAMQLAIHPMRDALDGAVQCFGVSGYSGAGTTPSDKNDLRKLADNLMPYALVNHIHEREVARHCAPVEFIPHVAPHFRGITMTCNLHLSRGFEASEVRERFESAYANEPLIHLQSDPPWVSDIAGKHGVRIGGFTLDASGRRLVVVSVLDNLLKGAATQAMQNINIALGIDEFTGLELEKTA